MNIAEFLDIKTSGKKILIADNVKNANRLVRKSGKILFNVEIKTLQNIVAEAISADLAHKGTVKKIQILSDKTCVYILYKIIKENLPNFIPTECININTAEGVLKAINMIRHGIPTQEYKSAKSDKLIQLKEIISLYEKYLSDNDLYDHARLINTDKKLFCDNGVSYYALESKNRTKKENELIEYLTKGKEDITYLSDDIFLKYDYRLAYGIENEVIFVADTIAANKSESLGNYAIYYTSEEYESILQGVFESKGIPCVLTSGIRAAQTNLISLMLGILNWAKNKYLYKLLQSVMSNPILRLDADNGSSVYRQYISALDSGLVYGIENYEGWLDRKKAEADEYKNERRTKEEVEAERKNKYAFIELMRKLTDVFSSENDLCGLFTNLFEFVKEHSNNRYFEEKKILYNRLSMLAKELRYYENGDKEKNIETLIDFLSDLKINFPERSDAVMAVRLFAPEVMERKYNFFIGLSASQFNSNIVESPILSDDEIKLYLDDEKLVSSKVNDIKCRNLKDTLATASPAANITLCSIVYDTVEMRPATPAPVYMELLGDKELSDKICGYDAIPDNTFRYERIRSKAEKPHLLVRRFEETRDISASSFQILLECPQRFFLNKVIGLYETEFRDRDSGKWLQPNEVGTYCHAILEEYVSEVIIKAKKNEYDEEAFKRIFEEKFSLVEATIFCDNAELKSVQKKDDFGKLEKYIKDMHTELSETDFTPVACEAKFDKAEKQLSIDGWSDTINFHGIIDRIDKNGDGKYRVVDYKTGNYKPDDKDTYKQHIAYPLASDIEQIGTIREKDVEFAYEYIFSKNRDEMRKTKSGEELDRLSDKELGVLKKVLKDKDYSLSFEDAAQNDHDRCKHCKYTDICNLRMGGDMYDE